MLHNTGPYGPNETSGAPMNMAPNGQMNIVNNVNHLAKIGHGNAPTHSGHYGLGEYGLYHHQNYNMAPPMAQFPNHQYQHLGYQSNYSNPNPGPVNEGNYQNGLVPMNLNVHSDHNTNIYNYPYERTPLETHKPDNVKEHTIRKVPLNIPQIPNKNYYNSDYLSNDSFQNTNHNLDLSIKSQDRLPLDNTRLKKIENTVKLIENILINSTNVHKETLPESTYGVPNVSSNKSPQADKTVALAEAAEDPLSLTMEDSKKVTIQTRPSIIKSPKVYNEDKIIETSEHDEDHKKPKATQADKVDVEPISIKLEFDPEDSSTDVDETIEIKIEKASWTDTDCTQPFFRDPHGFQRIEAYNLKIIDSETSVSDATAAIKKGLKSEDCFECPHCSILFKNPKRFLIHNKWHTFGLTLEKRTELQREREEKRNQRREAKIIERMKAKEVTDKQSAGKTWSCKDCDKIFSAKGSLKNHRQRAHPTRMRECRICHKAIIGWIALRNHMATHVAEAGAGYQCHMCPKRFKYSHSLAKHSDTHLEKIHSCAQCPKKFGSQMLLKMHMKSHERHQRGTTFRCTYCGKGFYEAYTLQVHERTHRNERPFLCEICQTSFGTNSSLKRHLKVSHSTSKPHECPVCHRSFSTEAIRDRHQLRLHGKPEDFKFPCKLCHCRYGQLKDLQKHVYKAHPKNKRKKKVKSETELMEDSE